MDWIKKNPEKFSLLVLSLALLGTAAYLLLSARAFVTGFEALKVEPVRNRKIPALETETLRAAQASLEKPATWAYDDEKEGSLFVSRPYIVQEKEGAPLGMLSEPPGGIWYPPVTNDWILKYHLNLMDPHVVNQDPDGDGWSNKEEYLAGTDPTDKNSHPEYTTKLFLEQYIQIPFRLIFHGKPDDKTYQIDTLDVHQPTQILEMGDLIPGTKYKIVKYQDKHHTDENGIDHDISELTIQNTETGKQLVLVVDVQANDPDSYALFKYLWKGTKEIKVKLDATFTIDPETDVTYKVVDIKTDQATIVNSKTNKEIKIPLLKAGETFHSPDGNYYDPMTGKEIIK